jgi:hypothetical protein
MEYDHYNLFLDDIRYPRDAYLSEKDISLIDATSVPENQWQIVRNYESFVRYINKNGLPDTVSFDHDLHDEHIRYYYAVTQPTGGVIEYESLQEKTGKSCAEFLVRKWFEADRPPIKVYIHSANQYGAKHIKGALKAITDHAPPTFSA